MLKSNYITEDQWATCLATGNFGRPINSYQKLVNSPDQENHEDYDLEETEIDETIDELERPTYEDDFGEIEETTGDDEDVEPPLLTNPED